MKFDTLARRAILFFAFVATTAVIYEITINILFTSFRYNDASIDPERDSHDYGFKVAAAVWRGAGEWVGVAGSTEDNGSIDRDESTEDKAGGSDEHGTGASPSQSYLRDPEQTSGSTARKHRIRSRHAHPKVDHFR